MNDPDPDLLDRFVEQRDQAAFAALVERHLPLVLGVCRRLLDHHDAEDAAQAVFLVLARRADRLDRRRPLGPWLYGVALNLARQTLRDRRSRERVQREASTMPQREPLHESFTVEIDAALAALPERERRSIILFHLEGRPVEEVAQMVGRPVGTVYSWLSRGRERLRLQLIRRGVAVTAVVLAGALGELGAREVPAGFAAAITGAAAAFLTKAGAAGPAAAIASQGIKTMGMLSAIKTSLIAAGLAVALGGAGWIVAAEGGVAQKKASDVLGAATFLPTPEHTVGWRGDGTGRYPGATPPIAWSRVRSGAGYEAKGIVWATPLPNIGVSSPIVVGARIFLTTEYSDLVCLDKQSGRILWIRSNLEFEGLSDEERKADPAYAEKLAPLLPQLAKANADLADGLNALQATAATSASHPPAGLARKQELEKQINAQQLAIDKKRYDRFWGQAIYGFAGQTATSDGKRVCAFFATGISACYDLDGNRKWIAGGLGVGTEHGNFASPLLCGNRLVVWAKGELRAYDVETGKPAWKTAYKSNGSNKYGSLFRVQAGGDLVAGFQAGWFARISDGKPLWGDNLFGDGVDTPIVDGGTIYASVGYGGWFYDHAAHPGPLEAGLRALAIPGSADASAMKELYTFKTEWAADEIPVDKVKKPFDREFNASPLLVDGLIYRLTVGGGLIVSNAANGEPVYRKVLTSLKPRTQYSDWGGASVSPTLAGKYLYLMDNQGTTLVIEPGKEYKGVAKNVVEELRDGKEQVQNLATPVFDGSRMYYRTPGYLYCIGDK